MNEKMAALLEGAGLKGKDAIALAAFIIGTGVVLTMFDGVMDYVNTGDTV